MRRLAATVVLAFALWALMFSPLTAPSVNFWWTMTASALALASLATLYRPAWLGEARLRPADVCAGIAMAALLWCVFWLAGKLAAMLFDFASRQVESVYALKDGQPLWLISLLMLLVIGPAEEVYWRGYVQRSLSLRLGRWGALAVTALVYALVHASSLNLMLTLAALVVGGAWGLFYAFFPRRLGTLMVAHAVWDFAVFVWFPLA